MQLEMFNEQLKIKCGLAYKAPEGGRQKGLYTSCRSPTRQSQGRLERILKRHRWCWLVEKTAATAQILLRPYPLSPLSNNSLSLQWGRATKLQLRGTGGNSCRWEGKQERKGSLLWEQQISPKAQVHRTCLSLSPLHPPHGNKHLVKVRVEYFSWESGKRLIVSG